MAFVLDHWKGKVAVVTGASAGIGAAVVEQLLCYDLKIVGLARRKEQIEKLGKRLKNKKGKLFALKTDITAETDIVQAFKWVEVNVGPIHILVNCAGIFRFSSLLDSHATLWKETFDTNVLGLCITTREAIKIMKNNNGNGQIININGDFGHQIKCFPNLNVYPASKFAVRAITESVRQELNISNIKIKITSISPSNVNSNFIKASGANAHYVEAMRIIPSLDPKDVADAICYVLSTPPNVLISEILINPVGGL
ncbi:hypothetical protein RN001_012000 [Aquatica leii]|uniref:Farnesol dehydrogenase-like n=1 Tax=Aquatica leii TaxID=1421715 RepID=A0AAN7SM97_9COLE|nr:hypothetical protein RN001_012000 [Aquatica leii]